MQVMLTDSAQLGVVTGLQDTSLRHVLCQDDALTEELAGYCSAPVGVEIKPSGSAYVTYTSGTTGTPKGVVVEHRNVVNFISGMIRELPFGTHASMLCVTTVSFDIFAAESWVPLSCGMQIVLAGEEAQQDPAVLAELLAQNPVQMAQMTPSRLMLLLGDARSAAQLRSIGTLLVGGEAFPSTLYGQLRKHTEAAVYNMYGPTETTVWSTFDRLEGEEPISIGRPMANTQVYVLNEALQPQPIGVSGELCIGGAGVARGYWSRPELTAEKFVDNPFVSGERLYRTGDLARWLPDGRLEHLGRIDHQVKIRGYRIELGEIEARLLRIPGVSEAVVTAVETKDHGPDLCAYVTGEHPLAAAELRTALAASLPSYMMPAHYMQLKELPLTPNGKVDRRALPKPSDSGVEAGYTAPRTNVEAKLAQLWQEVLGVERVGIRDNFFELNGHSLKAMTLVSKIHQALGVELPLRQLFLSPTVEGLTAALNAADGSAAYQALAPAGERTHYPLSSAQKRLYVLQQLEGAELSYNMPMALRLEGVLDRVRLEAALQALIARHESLRTSFAVVDGEPVQQVAEQAMFEVSYEEAKEEEAEEFIRAFLRPFDLSKAPLLRATVVRLEEARYLLLFDMHHIISDGMSISILVDEFAKLYTGEALEPLPLQYKDYAVWQREHYAASRAYEQLEAYWVEQFAGELPVLSLPADHPRPAVRSFEGGRVDVELDGDLASAVRELARASGATVYMVLLAAYSALLGRLGGQEEVIVGSPVAGRPHADLEGMLGMFVNTLALRTYPAGEKSFTAYLQEVKQTALAAFEHGDYPFEELVERVVRQRDTSRNPIFDAMLVLQNMDQAELKLPDLQLTPYLTENTAAKFDLTLIVSEQREGFSCSWEYSSALFTEETIRRWAEHFAELLRHVSREPETVLGAVSLLTAAQERRLMQEFNPPRIEPDSSKTIIELFEEQMLLNPNRTAVVFDNREMSYAELNDRANRLAQALKQRGAGPEDIVGVLVTRSAWMVVAVLAVWKSGGAYLPLDADYPAERIAYMLEESGARLLVAEREYGEEWGAACDVLYLEDDAAAISGGISLQLPEPGHLAYVIFTSGTTGKPKGVMIEHGHVIERIFAWKQAYSLDSQEVRLLQMASFSFDVFVEDMARTLPFGGTMVICPSELRLQPAAVAGLIRTHAITLLNSTPSLVMSIMKYIDEYKVDIPSLRLLILGGDRCLNPDFHWLLERFGHRMRIINCYGVTEATVDSTFYEWTGAPEPYPLTPSGHVPIGRPLQNVRLYVVEPQYGKLQPVGVYGELFIGGAGVGRGYVNRPRLSEERFISSSFMEGERLYKTGDLVRWLPDGSLEFAGRNDHQVKIRGYRIELGEIEQHLAELEGVAESAVVACELKQGELELCAYVVASKETEISSLRKALSARLPGFMVPSRFVQVEELPLTPNGKVDRRALPKPSGSEAAAGYTAPRTDVEAKLVKLWQEVLGVESVGIRDNFFELGGHSLKAMRLVSKIHQVLGVELPLRQLFLSPTVEGLAAALNAAEGSAAYQALAPAGERTHYPLSSAQKRLYVLQQLEGAELSYNMPMALQLEGVLDRVRLEAALQALIARHESLRTSFAVVDGEPVQQVQDEWTFSVSYEEAKEEKAEEFIRAFLRPFDLSKAPLLRATVVRLEEARYLLLFDMHHIISDGMSISILVDEFAKLYTGEALEPLPLQYKDYAVWQGEHYAASRAYEQLEAYWVEQLAGELPVLSLPADHPRPAVRSFEGGRVDVELDGDLASAVRELARASGATVYMVLLAAYSALLARLGGQEEVIVGSPVAGRPHADLEGMLGMFVNTLALRTYPAGEKSFTAYLQEVKQTALDAFEHGDYPFEELVERVVRQRDTSRNPIFDAMLVLQNMDQAELELPELQLTSYPFDSNVAKFDLTLSVSEQENGMRCSWEYAAMLFERSTIERWAGHFAELLRQITRDPQVPLGSVSFLTAAEQEQLLTQCNELTQFNELGQLKDNGTDVELPRGMTLHAMFEEQAAKTPERLAVVCGDDALTYRELNERANRLARVVRRYGAGPESLVAVQCERSVNMAVALLAVLKAGAAYLPISPQDPTERLKFLLEDSGATLLLSGTMQGAVSCPVLGLDDGRIELESPENLASSANRNNLAYVIYTSGTSGQPKGVMVEHGSIAHTLQWKAETYDFDGGRVLHASLFVFDAFISHFFGPLVAGATVVMLRDEELSDPEAIIRTLAEQEITHAQFPTILLAALLEMIEPEQLITVRSVVTGGEKISSALIEKMLAHHQIKFVSEYGPTENSVVTTALLVIDPRQSHTLGRSIGQTKVYVLDANGQLQPIGVPGELCISGPGLARGYLNQPELTAERFVASPFEPDERLYRTGDLARWLPDGNLEYMGRMDGQVKIRGYRIEPGEIEAKLLQLTGVSEAVVAALPDASGSLQLCAYVVGGELDLPELRSLLSSALPAYMVPSSFVQLEQLPLTANGKIDLKALPQPDAAMAHAPYAAPRTPAEQALATVWQQVLGVPRIGIHDSFFDLGGDSIKAIQAVSRMMQAGYKLDMKDLFRYPAAAQLSDHIVPVSRIAEQGEIRGPVPLTPIQHWFAERELADAHHFNQAVMLYREERFDVHALHLAMKRITVHHDALRMVFVPTANGSYAAWNRAVDEGERYGLEVFDFRQEQEWSRLVEAKARELQAGISLETGPLVKLGLFQCGDGDHLLIVIHHLVVDGISWRILLEDFASAYGQAAQGQDIRLPLKSDSFQVWSQQLAAYASSPAMEAEREYWNQMASREQMPLPKDNDQGGDAVENSETLTLQWSRRETRQLLSEAHRAYGTEINDLLLTALGMAIQEWTGSEQVAVMLEGHGRESILPDVDVSRTVGWFTSAYPVTLDLKAGLELPRRIKLVKETLRSIPHKGVGYGILRYLTSSREEGIRALAPEISFNYLGQFDQDLQRSELQISPLASGDAVSRRQKRAATLDFNGMIAGGTLTLNLSYSAEQYRKKTMQRLARRLKHHLQEVIQHCVAKEGVELTPSDVLQPGMTLEELEALVQRNRLIGDIENVYALTPMQQGMLFHSRLDPQSGAYVNQMLISLQGELDPTALERSWNTVIQRHAVLRTSVDSGWRDHPLQVVYRSRTLRIAYADLSMKSAAEQELELAFLKEEDRKKGFAVESDGLMRVAVVRTGPETHQLLWSFHHILMDGWCLPLVVKEVLEVYTALGKEEEPQLPRVSEYSEYLRWLSEQDMQTASKYWAGMLAGFEQAAELPRRQRQAQGYEAMRVTCSLDRKRTERIAQAAREQGVTVNTLLQTAWGVLLHKYSGTNDAVFGSVVSGRPASLPGVEGMIGLFINTIPVWVKSEAGDTVARVLQQVQEQALASQACDYYPLHEIQAQSARNRELFNHILVFENYPVEEQAGSLEDAAGLKITGIQAEERTNYDLNVMILPGKEMTLHFDYNAQVYERDGMERLQRHLMQIVEQIVEDSNIPVQNLELLTTAEREQLLVQFNDTKAAIPEEASIPSLFERQAAKTPDRPAVVCAEQRLTYRELEEQANRIAQWLRAHGVTAEERVGILMNRSPQLIAGLLGILKSGAAYVPIDPLLPEERMESMIRDSGMKVMLTDAAYVETLSVFKETSLRHALCVDDHELLAGYPFEPVGLKIKPTGSAYVIYTSGTTGTPKGVVVEHRNVVNFISGMIRELPFGTHASMLCVTTVSFDIFAAESWVPLSCGMQIVLAGEEAQQDPAVLAELLAQHPVQMAQMTPSRLMLLLGDARSAAQLRSIGTLLVGGEAFPSTLYGQLREHTDAAVYNMYGPTETTVWSTFDRLEGEEPISIGRPMANTQAYVLNEALQPQPIGVSGELCIGGAGVARGYWARPELTAEKFVDNPFVSGERLYRTGDLARWLPDGRLEHLGRIDHQVKIRGYRIELGEIEARLLRIPGVSEAVVTAAVIETGADSHHELCAYVTGNRPLAAAELRAALTVSLPSYMMPAHYMQLEELPLTPNGKVDRRALPKPSGSEAADGYTAPRTNVEAKLAQLWQEVLGVERVGIRDNFFELGGHSLKAMTLVSKIHQALGVEQPLRQLFLSPTVEGLATKLMAVDGSAAYQALAPAGERVHYPLSSAQKRLYFLQQLEGAELSYNMPVALRLEGALDRARLEAALQVLIARHESLRTSFADVDGEPVQRVQEEWTFCVSYAEAKEGEVEEFIQAFLRPFDLSEAPLLRATVLCLEETKHLLLMDIHHIISDGASMNILVAEFGKLYAGEALEPLKLQYKDYAVWQQEYVRSDAYREQEKYWLDQLAGELPVLQLPTDFARPALRSFAGDRIDFKLGRSLSEAVRQLALDKGVTVYMVFLAAYSTLLSRLSGDGEVIVGSPVAGRPHADLSDMMGMFVNTLALRTFPSGQKAFAEYLEEIKQTALDAFEHGEYPFEELVDRVVTQRDMSRNPLFDAVFVLQNAENSQLALPDLKVESYPFADTQAKFDLTLMISESAEGYHGSLEFATALFTRATIERWAGHLTELLDHVTSEPDTTLAEARLISGGPQLNELMTYSGLPFQDKPRTTIHQRFGEVAGLYPDQTAIVCGDRHLTYAELQLQASLVAARLRREGMRPRAAVAILAERSIEFVVAVLGILQAGGAYVPLDPDAPEERHLYILGDCGAEFLLATQKSKVPASYPGTVIILENGDLADEALEALERREAHDCSSDDPAYILYTSGTTGRPKGVLVTHGNVINLVNNDGYVPFHADHRFAQTGSVSFDAATFEIFGALLHGSSLHPIEKDVLLDARRMGAFLAEHGITVMFLTTSLFHHLADEDAGLFAGVEHLIMGGEVLSPKHAYAVKEACPGLTIWNGYGPTENTTFSTAFAVKGTNGKNSIPIGRPIEGTTAYVLSAQGQLLPVGVPGELCLGGAGVAAGYWNLPELTQEKFVPDPLIEGGRMYKTGDLARWLPDGTLEYLGRIDQQVKIRGYRIELGEIEARLLLHGNIRQAAVVTWEERPGSEVLCAYYVGGKRLEAAELRNYLSIALPEYMVPAYFVHLPELPLTRNGKLDRTALPEPERNAVTGTEFAAPRTLTEVRLALLWQDVLGVQRVGLNDNFFELGGHSLRAMTLVTRIHQKLNAQIKLHDVFQSPTLERMSQVIESSAGSPYEDLLPAPNQDSYPLSSAQKRMYVLQQLQGEEQTYNMPNIFRLEGPVNRERINDALQGLIRRHEVLRTSFEMVEGSPVQIIHDSVEFAVSYTETKDEENVSKAIRDFYFPFDLTRAPLLRAGLIRLQEEQHLLLFDMHHIISDGVSMSILIKEFGKLYSGESMPAPRLQYKDYSTWQSRYATTEDYKKQEAYWLNKYAGELPVLDLPLDYPRPPARSFAGGRVHLELDSSLTRKMAKLAQRTGTTLYMLLLAAYSTMLSRLSGQDDIIIGSPTAGRSHADLADMLGMFANTLALRTNPAGEKEFASYLLEVKECALDAFVHQDYPFEDLVEKAVSRRDMSRSPLFDVMLVLQNTEQGQMELEHVRLSAYPYEEHAAKFDLTLTVIEHEQGMSLTFGYAADLFARATIEQWAGYFKVLLESVVSDPKQRLADLPLLNEEERQRMQAYSQGAFLDICAGRTRTLDRWYEEQAGRTPDRYAVVSGERRLTYRELNEQSERLAELLRDRGVGPDRIVGLFLPPSPEMIVAMLAIWKAGGAYLPIDPDTNADRMTYMLENSEAVLLLTMSEWESRLHLPVECLSLDRLPARSSDVGTGRMEASRSLDNLAYVIYTSGSTGKPKGVKVMHRNVAAYAEWFIEEAAIVEEDRTALVSSFAFDLGYTAVFSALLSGAALYLPGKDTYMDPENMLEYLIRERITYVKMTPSLFGLLVRSPGFAEHPANGCLRLVVLGGEAINCADVELYFAKYERSQVMQHYGPTETTIGSIAIRMDLEQFRFFRNRPVLGRPIAGEEVYIVDSAARPVPMGVVGEIAIGGHGVSRGYVNRPNETEERFTSHPLDSNRRLYLTSDRGRVLADGTIEYLGRNDHQVKIRGYRVELGEIESRLRQMNKIVDAAVLAMPDAEGVLDLRAFVAVEGHMDMAGLREQLRLQLPAYMIPSRFHQLEKLPLTANGKVDRATLAKQQITMPVQQASYAAPRNALEQALADLWQEVLGVERVGIEDDFFEIGGQSLKLIQVIGKIRRKLKLDISLRDAFAYTTVSELAQFFEARGSKREDNEVSMWNPDNGLSLFCFPPIVGYGQVFMRMAEELQETAAIYAFDFIGAEDVIRHYTNRIQTLQPEGALHLLGYSAGGNLAFEVAKQLESEGREVAHLILLDSYPRKTALQAADQAAYAESLQDEISRFIAHVPEADVEEVFRNITRYKSWVDGVATDGRIQACIHLIQSEDAEEHPEQCYWKPWTAGEQILYQGSGKHEQMLEGEEARKNGSVVRAIFHGEAQSK
ncbi:non-ribosomal peptide synthase/polyketide synthase [Paenibacillus melissococcoides]